MKKRWIAALLCAVLLLGLAGAMAEDAMVPDHATGFGVYKYVYTRNGKPLHMRAQPSREAAVLLDIPYGGRVLYVYEENITWAYVQYGSTAGFVMQEYLVDYQPASPTPSGGGSSLPPSTSGSLGTLNQEFKTLRLVRRQYTIYASPVRSSGFVNLRFAPHAEAAIATICYDGHALTVIAETNSWYQVEDPVSGYTGYMMKRYTRTRR